MEIITTDQRTGKELILGRTIPFWAVTAFLTLLVITLLITIASTALVRITYSFSDPAQKGDVELVAIGQDLNEKKVSFIWGDVAAIPRDTQLLVVRSSSMETRLSLDSLPLFGVPAYDLVLHPQFGVSKLGFDTQGCNLVNQNGTFTHGCDSVSYIAKINRPDAGLWTTDKIPSPSSSVFSRYKQGFLTFQYADPQIGYFIPGGGNKNVSLPEDFIQRGEDQVAMISNQYDSSDDSFVVADFNKGEFAYVNNLDGSKNPKRFNKKANSDNRFNGSTCAKSSENLVCYYGPSAREVDSEDQDAKLYRTQHPYGQIEIISLKDTSQVKTYTLKAVSGADKIYISSSGTIYLLAANTLYAATPDGDSVKLKLAYGGVDSVGLSNSGSVFVSANNKVVEIIESEHTAYLRFQSDNIAATMLSVYDNTVLINAFINTAVGDPLGAYAHVYKLTDKPLVAGQNRKEDILPYRQVPEVYFMDYSDNQIYVTLRPIYSNGDDGTKRFDPVAVDNEKAVIQKRLSEDGLLTPGTNILFHN